MGRLLVAKSKHWNTTESSWAQQHKTEPEMGTPVWFCKRWLPSDFSHERTWTSYGNFVEGCTSAIEAQFLITQLLRGTEKQQRNNGFLVGSTERYLPYKNKKTVTLIIKMHWTVTELNYHLTLKALINVVSLNVAVTIGLEDL